MCLLSSQQWFLFRRFLATELLPDIAAEMNTQPTLIPKSSNILKYLEDDILEVLVRDLASSQALRLTTARNHDQAAQWRRRPYLPLTSLVV